MGEINRVFFFSFSAGWPWCRFLCWHGTFVLQIFLSKADNPWLGLILPGITFGLILYICTWAPAFDTLWYGLSRGNIPTVIYLLTYFFVRKRKKKR